MVDYNPNIPQATDNLSTSQGQILNNFTQLDTIFNIDHFKFDDNNTSARGMHRQINFPTTLVSDPTLSGAASEIYTKTISAVGEAFFANSTDASCIWRGGTGSGKVATGPGIITFPNGLIIQWDFEGSISNGATITFPTPFVSAPEFVSPFAVYTSGVPNIASTNNGSVTNLNFTISYRSAQGAAVFNQPIYWLAIGF